MSSVTGSRVGVIVGEDVTVGVELGSLVGVLDGMSVGLGRGEAVKVIVEVGRVEAVVAVRDAVAVGFGVGVFVAEGVLVGETTGLGVGVRLAVAVLEAVEVGAAVGVSLGIGLGVSVGGLPSSTNRPEAFHSVPTKICTSYVPGSHSGAGLVQPATATPAGKSFQDVVSTFLRAPF